MTAQRKRPTVGDTAWFVQWCDKLGWYGEPGKSDVDRDSCRERSKMFATREAAESFAREIWPVTQETFGIVEFWPATFVAYDEADAAIYPHAGFWEADSEGEIYEGPDA